MEYNSCWLSIARKVLLLAVNCPCLHNCVGHDKLYTLYVYIKHSMRNDRIVNPKKTTIVIDKATRALAQVQMANRRMERQTAISMADYIKELVYKDAGLSE